MKTNRKHSEAISVYISCRKLATSKRWTVIYVRMVFSFLPDMYKITLKFQAKIPSSVWYNVLVKKNINL